MSEDPPAAHLANQHFTFLNAGLVNVAGSQAFIALNSTDQGNPMTYLPAATWVAMSLFTLGCATAPSAHDQHRYGAHDHHAAHTLVQHRAPSKAQHCVRHHNHWDCKR